MTLYDYVFYVVTTLIGQFTSSGYGSYPMLYASHKGMIGNINWYYDSFTLQYAWNDLASRSDVSWINNFFNNPPLLMSTIIYVLCVVFSVELCLIMPFRWFKRLIQFPDHKLLTPNEYKRSKRK